MPRKYLLDFEKPLVELEKQIEQIRELARDSEVDVSQQLLQLEGILLVLVDGEGASRPTSPDNGGGKAPSRTRI